MQCFVRWFLGAWLVSVGAGCNRATSEDAPPANPAATAADGAEASAARRRCWERFQTPPTTAEEAHDAYLETAERLEDCLRRYPKQIGVLGDLIGVYIALLDFEAESDYGGNLIRLASLRIGQYMTAAAPLDSADRLQVARWKARLFLAMRCYPMTEQLLREAGDDPTTRLMHETLRALGQSRFYEYEPFVVGPATVRVFGCLQTSPDPQLLWNDVVFTTARRAEALPHEIVTYALVRRGTATNPRYYLYLQVLNRAELLRAYGATKPEPAELRQVVATEIATYLARRAPTPRKEQP